MSPASEICDTILTFILETPPPHHPEVAERLFSQLDVDSVSIFQLQIQIEDHYGVALEDSFLFEHPSPEKAAIALFRRIDGGSAANSAD